MCNTPPGGCGRPCRCRRNHTPRRAAAHASRGGIHFVRIKHDSPAERVLYAAPAAKNEFGALSPYHSAPVLRGIESWCVSCCKLGDQAEQVLALRTRRDIRTGDRLIPLLVRGRQRTRDKNRFRLRLVIGSSAIIVLWRRRRRSPHRVGAVTVPARESVRTA